MNTRTGIAAAVVALALVGTRCGGAQPAAPPPGPAMVTVTVGMSEAQQMTYTDPAAPGGLGTVTQETFDPAVARVTVPRGTTVTVDVSQPLPVGPQCWISDATDRLVYVRGTDLCRTVAQ